MLVLCSVSYCGHKTRHLVSKGIQVECLALASYSAGAGFDSMPESDFREVFILKFQVYVRMYSLFKDALSGSDYTMLSKRNKS